MSVILGIDLGTSSLKVMLLDCDNNKTIVESLKYSVDIPRMNYAEQSPEKWWEAAKHVLKSLKSSHPAEFGRIAAIGFSGQMHGLVLADKDGHSLRPAILWLDQRSGRELELINEKMDMEEMGQIFRNRVFTGFAFPSLLWVKENEKEIFDKIRYIMMPKDYIRMKITGTIATEMSDASATAIFDTAKRSWAWDVIRRFGLPEKIFPECKESTEIAGYVTDICAQETGLKKGIPVVFGAGDQQAQSIGNGCFMPGTIISNIGTGGQISTCVNEPAYDSKLRTHTFCNALGKYYTIMGATLCSGLSLNWLMNNLLGIEDYAELSKMAGVAKPGSRGLIYLPYLTGERTPYMNPAAKGMFFGLTLSHDRMDFVRSVMEGVTFSLKDSLSIFKELHIEGDTIIASGGGASSREWLQIQADIFEKPVRVSSVSEQACLGACILAGIGTEIYKNAKEACEKLVSFQEKVYEPIRQNTEIYREQYIKFGRLYTNNKALMD